MVRNNNSAIFRSQIGGMGGSISLAAIYKIEHVSALFLCYLANLLCLTPRNNWLTIFLYFSPRFVANKLLHRRSPHPHSATGNENVVEWAYAFDVHCNAVIPLVALLGGKLNIGLHWFDSWVHGWFRFSFYLGQDWKIEKFSAPALYHRWLIN